MFAGAWSLSSWVFFALLFLAGVEGKDGTLIPRTPPYCREPQSWQSPICTLRQFTDSNMLEPMLTGSQGGLGSLALPQYLLQCAMSETILSQLLSPLSE